MLFYNSATGAYATGKFDDAGLWHGGTSGTIGTGWEQVAVAGHTWVVLYKNGSPLATVELRELHAGSLSASVLSTANPPDDKMAKDRTLVACLNGSQFGYNATTAEARNLGWYARTTVEHAQVTLRDYPAGFSSGWQHIVSLGAS